MNINATAQTGLSPTHNDIAGTETTTKTNVHVLIKILALSVPILSFGMNNWLTFTMALMGNNVHSLEIAYFAGSLFGTFCFSIIVVLLLQIGKRFRNSRSRWLIFLNTGLVLLAISILNPILKILNSLII